MNKLFSDIKKSFRNIPFLIKNKKQFIYISVAFFLCVIILCLYLFGILLVLEKETIKREEAAVSQLGENIELKMETTSKSLDLLFVNPIVKKYLTQLYVPNVSWIDESRELEEIMRGVKDGNLYTIRFYVNDQKKYARQGVNFFPLSSAKKEAWYNKVASKRGGVYWGIYELDGEMMILCARSISSQIGSENPDAIVVGYSRANYMFSSILVANSSMLNENEFYFGNGHFKPQYAQFEQASGIIKNTLGTVIYHKIENTDWYVYDIINSGQGTTGSLYIFSFTVLSAILLIVFFVISSNIITTSRLKHEISEAVEIIDSKKSDTSKDFIKKSLNMLVPKVKDLLDKRNEIILQEREARLYAFQAQINPHFLYNTIDMIKWHILDKDTNNATIMLDNLVRYFRLNLSNGKIIVKLSEEIELIKTYFSIQNERFDGVFALNIRADTNILDCYIPKLIIQPIVENALMHGLYNLKDRKGIITVEANIVGEFIVIKVSDNGTGINQEELKNIGDFESNKGKARYALKNVDMRLKLFSDFNNACGVKIFSKEGVGTTVELTLKCSYNIPDDIFSL